MADKRLLVETLNKLSSEELDKFKSLVEVEKCFPLTSRRRLKVANTQQVVELMVETFGQEYVEVTKQVLKDMKKTDLVQTLSDTSSGTKEKHSVDDQQPSLIQREEKMVSDIQLLLETLADLSDRETKYFKQQLWTLIRHRHLYSDITSTLLEETNMLGTVLSMVKTLGQRSVETTKVILTAIKRTDLVQRLSDSSSTPKKKLSEDEDLSTLIHKVASMAAVKDLLLETLTGLSYEDFQKFKWFLQLTCFQRNFSYIPWRRLEMLDEPEQLMELMVEMCGQKSLDVTREVLIDMNKTDLVERFSEISSEPKEKQSGDEHQPAPFERGTIAAVKNLLVETLKSLSQEEIQKFTWLLQCTCFQKGLQQIPWRQLQSANRMKIVNQIMQTYDLQCVEVTKDVFMDMNRTDLVQRLSETSSGSKGKKVFSLPHKVASMAAVKDLLLETLTGLSYEDFQKFKWFLHLTCFQRNFSYIPWRRLEMLDEPEQLVELIVEMCGQKSVDVTRKVLIDMNRTDELRSGLKASGSSAEVFGVITTEGEKNERCSALIQKEETLVSDIQLLLETLAGLSSREFNNFKQVVRHKPHTDIPWRLFTDVQDTVLLMVQTFSQQSVEMTKKILKKMKRTDLVQKLSDSSSGPTKKLSADRHSSTLIHKVVTIAAVKMLLLETLNDLSQEELEEFNKILQWEDFKYSRWDYSYWPLMVGTNITTTVEVLMQTYGQQCVKMTRKVLIDMNKTDLVERLSEISSEPKEKQSGDEHQPAPFERNVTLTSVEEKLLETLEDLSYGEFERFKLFLQLTTTKTGLPRIPGHRIELAETRDMVKLMVQTYGEESVEVTREVLEKINRKDLVQMLSDTSSGSKGASRNLELESCGSTMQEPCSWTKLEPELNNTEAEEAPTYSLQSEAGNFECSVSDLRWVCEEKVSFKYQFCSWEGHMERMESREFMPAGPMLDITVIVGKLSEVYLPHWICTDENPGILDKFSVLHIDDCGDVVEKVSQVTPSHVKLSEPVFSPRAVLMKAGFPVKIKCNVLIYYKPNKPFLKLHVYLIPQDPVLQKTVDKSEMSDQYERIKKPHPDKYLKMQKGFNLTASMDTAAINPKKLTLRYDSQDPNFYEVFIENPDSSFHLSLSHPHTNNEPLWTCDIRKDDYPKSGHLEAAKSSTGPCCDAAVREVEQPSELTLKATVTAVKEELLKTLEQLKEEELKEFKWYLKDNDIQPGLPCIPSCRLEKADLLDLVDLMMKTYSQESLEVTKMVLRKIKRNDLVHM